MVSAPFDPTVCEPGDGHDHGGATCGAGTYLSAANVCEISCDDSTSDRRLDEHIAPWESTADRIVSDFMANMDPRLAGKMDDELRDQMLKLGQLFGQPALA